MIEKIKDEKGVTFLQFITVGVIVTALSTGAAIKYIDMADIARRSKCLENQMAYFAAAKISYAESALTGSPSFPETFAELEPKMARHYSHLCTNDDGTELDYDSTTGMVTCPNHPREIAD